MLIRLPLPLEEQNDLGLQSAQTSQFQYLELLGYLINQSIFCPVYN